MANQGRDYEQQITSIEVDLKTDDVSFYFGWKEEPFNVVEFVAGTKTHELLSAIESRIREFNRYVTRT